MGKVYARPPLGGSVPPWSGQTEVLENNDVIDQAPVPRRSSMKKVVPRDGAYGPVDEVPRGNYRFGELRGGRRGSSFHEDGVSRDRRHRGNGILGDPNSGIPPAIEREFLEHSTIRRFIFKDDLENAEASHSEDERVLDPRLRNEYVSRPNRKRAHEDSDLDIDEPHGWKNQTPISSQQGNKKVRIEEPETRGDNNPPEIDLSRIIPCGKVHLAGKYPHNNGLFTRSDPTKQHEMASFSGRPNFSDENVIQSIEPDEIRRRKEKRKADQPNANSLLRQQHNANLFQTQNIGRQSGNGAHTPKDSNAAQTGRAPVPAGQLGDLQRPEDTSEYTSEYTPEDTSEEESDSVNDGPEGSKGRRQVEKGRQRKFPQTELLVIRPARPKALSLRANHTPIDFAEVVRQFWPRVPPGEPEIDIGYDDDFDQKRWISFAGARGQLDWPEPHIDALQGVTEAIVHLQYESIEVRGSLRGAVTAEDNRDAVPEVKINREKYNKLIIKQLKEELKKRNLVPKGNKPELIKQLLEHDYNAAVEIARAQRRAQAKLYDDPKQYRSSTWQVASREEPEAWDDQAMKTNLKNFKEALIKLSDGFRTLERMPLPLKTPENSDDSVQDEVFQFENLPPLKIQVDRYQDEWLRWDRYMAPEDFHHDIFLKIDHPVINVYNVLGDPDEPYEYEQSEASEGVDDEDDDMPRTRREPQKREGSNRSEKSPNTRAEELRKKFPPGPLLRPKAGMK